MSLNTPPTPTLKPTNLSSIKNIPLLKEIKNAENLLDSQEESQDMMEHISERKSSIYQTKANPSLYKNLFNDHQNRYIPETNEEALENINKVKDYKWTLGMILIDKINSLKNEIREKRKDIENKKKEFEKKNVYKEKINYLNKLLKKEEAEGFPQEKKTNKALKERKEAIEQQINEIEMKKNKLKDEMLQKHQMMFDLKEKLNKSLKELTSIEDKINNRNYIYDQEESEKEKERKREMSQKLFPKEEKLLHLSQNIGEYINHTLLIKDENNI